MIQKMTPDQAPQVPAAVDGRIMFGHDRLEVILLSLQAGEAIPAHTNPFDVLFVGLQGNAHIEATSGAVVLQPHQTLFVSADEQRSLSNPSPETLKVMVIKIQR